MTWFLLSLVTALGVASSDAGMKKWFSHLTPCEMTLLPLVYGSPVMLLSLLWIDTPPLDRAFYLLFVVCLPLNIVPMVIYMKAIKVSPLSLTVPYLAFTPVFIIGTGFLLLGEEVDRWGAAGILTVCAGSYVLNISDRNRTVLDPLLAVFKETGSWLMLIVALIFSVSSVVGKMAMLHSSPLFFQTTFILVLTLTMIVVFGLLRQIRLSSFRQYPLQAVLIGLLTATHNFCHASAIALTKAAYMITIKRFSVVFGVIYGGLVFREENIRTRLAGAVLMFAGAALIILKAN